MYKKLPCSSTKKFLYWGWDNYLRTFHTNIGKGYHKNFTFNQRLNYQRKGDRLFRKFKLIIYNPYDMD